jgi:Carboxypeptidase regulatory-like domain/Ankyrin repeats (3 copies)
MPERTTILDGVNVASPCNADWDEMIGNDEVRFCLHCSKHVNNLSEMTRKRALELVARSKGRLCLRYYRRPDGRVQTTDRDNRLYSITRRTSRLAAGAFTAVLGLCSGVAAQVAPSDTQSVSRSAEQADADLTALPDFVDRMNATLTGSVVDPFGALAPGVNVILRKEGSLQEQTATSDSEGQYRFENLGIGVYTLRFESPHFKVGEAKGIVVAAGAEVKFDMAVSPKKEFVTMGVGITVSADDPLVKAASENDLKTVKNLIAAGSDVNRRDERTDSTALDEAVGYGNREMARALLDAGAEINARNRRRQTALMMMDNDATVELVWDLVAAGAKVNLRDEDKDTALMLAAAWSVPEVLRALLDAGAKINVRNKEGVTALMYAARVGNLNNVRLLLASGAEINAKNNEGVTAFKLADENGYEEVVGLLRAHMAVE